MPQDTLEVVKRWVEEIGPLPLAGYCAAAVLLLVLLVYFWRRRKGPPPLREPSLIVDLEGLDVPPPEDGPALHCHGLPVRLAVLVLAPSGRGGEVPTGVNRSAAIDQIVPGLARIAAAHGTLVMIWPQQLSPRGFAHLFFANVKLPRDRGKGTPWCSLAGKFEADGQQIMAGMALCGSKPNSLSQYIIDLPSEWLEVLRVERA